MRCAEAETDGKIEMYLRLTALYNCGLCRVLRSQLVQALKHQNFYDSSLCQFLLRRALKNQRLGHKVI